MQEPIGLPDDIDPELWFECRKHPGERDYILREPWQTFPGRIQAWCQTDQVSFRVSKSEMTGALAEATRYWVDGFLVGNTPRQPDVDDFDDPAVIAWRSKAEQFLVDGLWPQMSDLKWQWFEDAQVLAEIGRTLGDQALPIVEVRLPASLGDRAVAAWTREDEGRVEPDENAVDRMYRRRAAVLALIGLAIETRGTGTGEDIDVPLSVDLVVNAIDAGEAP